MRQRSCLSGVLALLCAVSAVLGSGLLGLAQRHPCRSIEKACEIAQTYGAYRLRVIRALIKREAPR